MKVKFRGNDVLLSENIKRVGETAPEVCLVAKDLSLQKVGGAQGKYQIINVVPSLDTGVCATQARRFNKEAASLPHAVVYVVSYDLPFAQNRFCQTEGIQNVVVLSDFREGAFAKAYGLRMADGALAGLLARAVIVVDPSGKIIYQEICDEITNEPDYQAVLDSIKS